MKICSFVSKKRREEGGWQMRSSVLRVKFTLLYFPCDPMDRTLIPQRLLTIMSNFLATADIYVTLEVA